MGEAALIPPAGTVARQPITPPASFINRIAAQSVGRRHIGIEMDADHAEVAQARL
jgi:hypothetical protein